AQGVLMSGINVNGGTYVDGISGIWSAGFTTTTTTQGPIQGNSSETFTQLTCPAGYRMTGITGRSGAYIDAIAIICKTQDQSQTYTSSTFGGSGGNAYTLSCPAGQFVTNLDGTSGNYLDDLYLGCR
ncbi:MAG: jacalin-like lectin, partial [Bdellovibrionota bacterium]